VIHHFWLLNHFRKDLHFNKKMVNWEAYSNQQLRKYSLITEKGVVMEIVTSKMQPWSLIC
jgi:hypothetical protein